VDEVNDAGVSEELGPTIYVPYRRDNQATVFMTLLARLSSDVPPSERVIKNALWQVDRSQAISRIALVTDLANESAAAPRFRALVAALLGLAALIFVAGGIYALTLFNVLKRTREIGLRAALGAHPRTLIEGTVWMGLRPVALGMIVGLVAALPAVQVMQRVVKETLSANDLPLLVAVLAGLLASGALCALIPALRATRISPIVALRD
jgi:predicted lysophospholipase L1 biosynthesis ABC-type transport system permease subunit